MMIEKRALQGAVALAGLVPFYAGGRGALLGARAFGAAATPAFDSHVRYLSGLLLGVGLIFWSSIPRIERRGEVFRVLTAAVVLGGLARLAGLAATGWPGEGMAFGLVMEVAITPLLCLWQARVARRHAAAAPSSGPADSVTGSGSRGSPAGR